MSKEDIDRAVKEAEQYAAEDKKNRENVDIRNNADQLVYQTEKTLGEIGDKITEDEKKEIQGKIDELKEALKGTDTDAIKAKTEEAQQAFYKVSEKLYQAAQQAAQAQAAQGGQPGGNAGTAPQDDVVDADFTEADDDKK